MAQRHRDALGIQAGACNPSGIAHSIIDACKAIRDEPGHTGTDSITKDPAVRLMVHQLAFICGVISTCADLNDAPNYDACMAECRKLAV